MASLLTDFRRAVIALVVMTVLVGLAYPIAVWAIGQAAFRGAANGSLVERDGSTVGSSLIGQQFDDPRYFWGRPSAAGDGYDPTKSGASNLGPTSLVLDEAVKERLDALLAAHPGKRASDVPPEMVTASGSGLDPHISPAGADFQVDRVAAARGLPVERVRQLVAEHTSGRDLGVLGEPRVNVLELNLALDRLGSGPSS
jgi:potassium-transporting ATPase KdpC subunit